MNPIVLHELVEKAVETGVVGPLLDWLEENEHPKAKELRQYFALVEGEYSPKSIRYSEVNKGITFDMHLPGCDVCIDELRKLL